MQGAVGYGLEGLSHPLKLGGVQQCTSTYLNMPNSAALSAGALASSLAHATTFNIGGFEVNMDTTVSAGATWLTSDRNKSYLPEANGGNPDLNLHSILAPVPLPEQQLPQHHADIWWLHNHCSAGSNIFNHDGSINSDDGRLNFDRVILPRSAQGWSRI